MKKLIIALAMVFSAAAGATATEIDNGENAAVFVVDGNVVSAPAAVDAYNAGKMVQKCTPIKGAVDSKGESITARKCKAVKRVMNAKTGNTTWKSL